MKYYLLNPEGVPCNPHLFPQWESTWAENGWEKVNAISQAQIILIDLHTRIANYNQEDVDYILGCNTPIADFCEYDRLGMSTEIWPNPLTPQQKEIFDYINDGRIKAIHFSRLIDKRLPMASFVHPYEKSIMYEEPMTTAEELFSRDVDVCFIANTSPSRYEIARSLRYFSNKMYADGKKFKCHISIANPKISFDEFIAEHKKAKLFVSSSGGGATDERKQLLFSISPFIMERTNQLLLHPFTDGYNCILIDSPPTKEQLNKIYELVNNKERLYNIYMANYVFMKAYYSSSYIAKNILDVITANL